MALAFVGDAVQSLYTRTRVTIGSTQKTGALHHEVIKVVKAVSQAAEAEKLLPLLMRRNKTSSAERAIAKCKRAQNTPK